MVDEHTRFEVERVSLSKLERVALFRQHQRVVSELRSVFDEQTQKLIVKSIPLATPVCGACGEPWETEGCSTVRALTLLSIHERTIAKQVRRVTELTDALLPRFGAWRLRDPGNRTVELRIQIDEFTIAQGKLPLVEAALVRMRDEFRVWLKKVGDLARIRADHAQALAMDSEYYTYLATEFDPTAPFAKQPGAPWE